MSRTERKLKYVAPGDDGERVRILACNRVLLYARGLDLDARAGLELAEESLDRAGDAADLEHILVQMHILLHERGIDPFLSGGNGERLASAPPIRRASMVSGGARCRSFVGWALGGLRCAAAAVNPGKLLWKRHET